MNIIKLAIFKWLNLEQPPCESCETLKAQLDIANYERKQLLDTIISFTRPAAIIQEASPKEIAPIKPKAVLWSTRRQMLEQNDRITAEKLKEAAKITEELEKQVQEEANATGTESSTS